jgi:lactate dehydrogenase-like 2-hydroxyacid dehydrogenase
VLVCRLLPEQALSPLREVAQVEVWPAALPPSPEELAARAADCEGLLTLLTDRVDAALLARCPRLKVVSNLAVGVDNVDVAACTARGLPVGHTPGVLTEATADLAFALLLASARRLPEGEARVRGGRWRTWAPWGPEALLGAHVHGATLGIVGFGAIGRAVARRARGFSMRVLCATRRPGAVAPEEAEAVGLEELLARSDFVSLHCPLTPETRGLMDAARLRRMRPTAHLVNTARGAVVDPAALAGALHGGWLAGAALDVTDPEPLPADHPLLSAPNLLVVPHVASATAPTRLAMARLAVDNLLAGLAGRPLPHTVNPEVHRP